MVARPDGSLVSAGRNRVADTDAPPGEVAGSSVAHAEINALARVPFRHVRELVLTTTLQPCLQCWAVIRMSPVAAVRAAGADPLWDGCHDFSSLSAWTARRPPIPMEGPQHDEVGLFGTLISRFGLGLVPTVEDALRAHGQAELIDLVQQLERDGAVSELAALEVDAAFAALLPDLRRLAS